MKPPRTTPLLGAGLLVLIASAGGIPGQKTANSPPAGEAKKSAEKWEKAAQQAAAEWAKK
jgi:hypothetical protein